MLKNKYKEKVEYKKMKKTILALTIGLTFAGATMAQDGAKPKIVPVSKTAAGSVTISPTVSSKLSVKSEGPRDTDQILREIARKQAELELKKIDFEMQKMDLDIQEKMNKAAPQKSAISSLPPPVSISIPPPSSMPALSLPAPTPKPVETAVIPKSAPPPVNLKTENPVISQAVINNNLRNSVSSYSVVNVYGFDGNFTADVVFNDSEPYTVTEGDVLGEDLVISKIDSNGISIKDKNNKETKVGVKMAQASFQAMPFSAIGSSTPKAPPIGSTPATTAPKANSALDALQNAFQQSLPASKIITPDYAK